MSSVPPPTISPDRIKGNASDGAKELLSNPAAFFQGRQELRTLPVFGDDINRRVVVTEANIKAGPRSHCIALLVAEYLIDMTNGGGGIHGGCLAFLVDCLTTLALVAYSLDVDDQFFAGVSQNINVTYHSPAAAGDKLRIVNYTVAGGARAKTARCEIWNATHHRIVASGSHIKMNPSQPSSKL
ncbi:hypothetical protein D9756_000113 [Leucocoprinus leucothites]|uniref:Thioesterase domain-containing protein n=1 Tax=Leucocoprinus leucothites TaxID=201217 RepID=A0A8H5GEX7_9AGAR|nr:hypothetical protein D9756_000113 [Leucoagaricus leucothites]